MDFIARSDTNEVVEQELMPITVLFLEDERDYYDSMYYRIQREAPDIKVLGRARDKDELLEMIKREPPELVVFDLRMYRVADAGLEALAEVREQFKSIKCLVYTFLYDRLDLFVRALILHTHGYALKQPAQGEQHSIAMLIRLVARGYGYYEPEMVLRMADLVPEASLVTRKDGDGGYEHLTPKEKEVLRGILDNLSNRQIGERLGLAEPTIKQYTVNIFRKLRVDGRHKAADAARMLFSDEAVQGQ